MTDMDRNPFKGSDQVFGGKDNDPGEQRKQADQDSTPTGAGGENDPGEQAQVVRPDLADPGRTEQSSDSSKSGQSKKPSKKK